nr:unnamed protein product [Callosobruchus chinensis]
MKEQFNRDMKNVLKKNRESIDKLRQQHDAAKRKLSEKQDRLKQLLDDQKKKSMDVESKFDRDIMNLLKKNEQREETLKSFTEKHCKEVAVLQNKIKRLKALDQLKKAEKESDQAQDRNVTLKQKITQLEQRTHAITRMLTVRLLTLEMPSSRRASESCEKGWYSWKQKTRS